MKRSILAIALAATPVLADPPVVKNVNMKKVGDSWDFDVTIRHDDTGWDDYADAWRILDGEGKELGMRNLAHPHVNEQPFTRSLSGVKIPEGVTEIGIQARDNVNGWSPEIKRIKLR
ncbi:hypothetical protein BOO69_00860 [Sulfitobacter alexandrii]|uniref:Uncharacterized protein n=1 Tax=Sulfitobacter alexandrii TaxID=1917485 RepID=A0A1J0WLM7_9RHOB|nr:hypothetical protein BOO69_00860 [Sulfitobacter alexandrii]